MSCPYLERGSICRCHAMGRRGMEVKAESIGADCFSGDFSHCSLLLFPPIQERKSWRPALSRKMNSKDEEGADEWRKCLPAV